MVQATSNNKSIAGVRSGFPRAFIALALGAWFLCGSLINSVQAAAGDLDPSFGNGGKVVTDFGHKEQLQELVLQSDGKIVAAGYFSDGPDVTYPHDLLLARYHRDGSLDSSFGAGGSVTSHFINNGPLDSLALALQSNGKIVVAGTHIQTSSDFGLARFNSDGSLDASFGTGGYVATDFGDLEQAFAVAIQTDGKIIVGGLARGASTGGDFALARYNSDGSLDAGFGTGGKVMTDFHGYDDKTSALAILSSGKIIAAGQSNDVATNFDFALAQYNPDGSLDSGFGTGGKVVTNFYNAIDEVHALVIQGDGKIVTAGIAYGAPSQADFALVRYNSDGSLDSGFGTGGKVVTDFAGTNDSALDLAIQSDGKLIAVGFGVTTSPNYQQFAVVRYNGDGSLDSSFGTGGKTITPFHTPSVALAVRIQPDGRILAGGVAADDFVLARYTNDLFDTCIQDDYSGNLFQLNSLTGEYGFTDCQGFILSGTGTVKKKGSIITVEHYAADRSVLVKIDGSTKKATASINLFSQGRSYSISDRNTTNNTCLCR
jgi:uncharacterized delta-60 repeat protein